MANRYGLRQMGIDALAHPLADALFRTDMWSGNTVLEIYIKNPRYRREDHGRKHRAEQILGDRNRFRFVTLQMAKPTKYDRSSYLQMRKSVAARTLSPHPSCMIASVDLNPC
ncbi:hypothetical protein NWFMUON74_20130 [Nocardia wallacei]|uniref:Uncharacterized protein n=1 Tax=Nocardia wallacei TaxID=480035 RepID=A0A7G1KH27_9NOCA|nr:hypothetical protein NWFMUON74_20130 [Nocardia wallacei]